MTEPRRAEQPNGGSVTGMKHKPGTVELTGFFVACNPYPAEQRPMVHHPNKCRVKNSRNFHKALKAPHLLQQAVPRLTFYLVLCGWGGGQPLRDEHIFGARGSAWVCVQLLSAPPCSYILAIFYGPVFGSVVNLRLSQVG